MASSPVTTAAGKARLGLAVKFLVAVAAVAALFYFRMIRVDVLVPLLDHPALLLIVAALIFCMLPLGALRWRILLAAQGIVLPFRQIYHICAIGAFSGTFLPGAVGGDALRFIYLSAAVPRHRTIIGVTLLSDRLLGIAGLVMVAIAAMILQWPTVVASPVIAPFALFVMCGFAVAVAVGGVLLIMLDRLPVDDWSLHSRGLILRLLGTVIDVVALYRRSPGRLIAAFAISVVIQLCLAFVVVLLAEAMDLSASIGPLQYALAASISILASAIPITPGGLGVGEGAFQHLCQLLNNGGQAPFASAFFAFRALTIAVLLVAIPSLIVYRARRTP
jgi:glycosyltransferase 2 family protein